MQKGKDGGSSGDIVAFGMGIAYRIGIDDTVGKVGVFFFISFTQSIKDWLSTSQTKLSNPSSIADGDTGWQEKHL